MEKTYTKPTTVQVVDIRIYCNLGKGGELFPLLTLSTLLTADDSEFAESEEFMSFKNIEHLDVRIGDIYAAIPADDGESMRFDFGNPKRTSNFPQWQPPTICPKCHGELMSVNNHVYCQTYFEHGAH